MTVETKENLGNDHPGLSSPDTIVHALYSWQHKTHLLHLYKIFHICTLFNHCCFMLYSLKQKWEKLLCLPIWKTAKWYISVMHGTQ